MINTIHFNMGGNVKQSTSGPWEASEVDESDRPCPKSKKKEKTQQGY